MRYSKIDKIECCNGEGFGVSVFVQGCHFHCKNCFNPETWDFDGGELWDRKVTDKVLELLDNPHITRLSILGGEPLAWENVIGVHKLISEVRHRFGEKKKVWLYTGYNMDEVKMMSSSEYLYATENMIRLDTMFKCDYVVDGRYIDELKDLSLAFRGSSNQRIIDVKKTKESNKVVLWETDND